MCNPSCVLPRFEFRDTHRRVGICRIEAICLGDGRTAVIATELSDNPGTSITNAAEYVAGEACRHLDIDPRRLVWVEHYPADPCFVCSGIGERRGLRCPACHGRGTRRENATYDLVSFAHITPGAEIFFHEPNWRPIKDADWRALGLEPRAV
jgi:hypothetical protein